VITPDSLDSARQTILHAQNIVVVSHIRPDGDSIGSILGLGLALEAMGKDVQMISPDGVPANFLHLEGTERIKQKTKGEIDLAIVVDCSDLSRAGHVLDAYGAPDINVDHHPGNTQFARINLINETAVSTTEIIGTNADALELPITKLAGQGLMLGLITDTIGFRTANMNANAMRLAASLMDLGVDLPDIYFKVLVERSFPAIRYWGQGLTNLQREGRLVWTTLSLRDRETASYPGGDDADLVSVLSSVNDADIAVIFIEQNPERVKVSWRARPGFDTSQIARRFGGGGHHAASGAEVEGLLEEVEEKVLEATRTLFQKERG